MADTWKGFTEEDIGLFQKNNQERNEKVVSHKKAASLLGPDARKGRKQKSFGFHDKRHEVREIESEIPESAKLFKEPEDSARSLIDVGVDDGESETDGGGEPVDGERDEKEEMEIEKTERPPCHLTVIGSNPICLKVVEGKAYELVDKKTAEMSKATLEIFETRQKKLEEQNKKKKAMLAEVITARKRQTNEEAKRLQHIQEELQKLDLSLSTEVGILRNKIEEATVDFAEAQKRYNRAEKEFLEAKQSLFGRLEKKELLTKLLCTIIEQNEMRKAQKLSELMEKLEIKENGTIVDSGKGGSVIESRTNSLPGETVETNVSR